jgi:hypothetical protein
MAVMAAAAVCVLALTTPSGGSSTPPGSSRPGVSAPTTTVAQDSPVPLGAYGGPGGASTVASLAGTTGARITYALDYFDDTSWQTLDDPAWIVSQWAHTDYTMIWGVPMLPSSGASLAEGATGAYDGQFAQLARFLVAQGQGSSTLMLGFDPDQQSNPWSASTPTEASAYVAYWRQIVTTMRAVPGAGFQFTWNLVGSGTIPLESLYPGDGYVDTVATGVVDQTTASVPPGGRWTAIGDAAVGAQWFASFATLHHKGFSIISFILVPATTPGGGGDDPSFVQQFLAWASAVHASSAVVWDFGPSSISSGGFPASLAALGQAGTPAPAP